MTTTTEERGKLNLFAKEPPMTFDEKYTVNHNERAEQLNGRFANRPSNPWHLVIERSLDGRLL